MATVSNEPVVNVVNVGWAESSRPTNYLEMSFIVQLDGRADGFEHRLVFFQLQIVKLTQDKHSAPAAVETSRPAGIGQVKAEKANVMPHGRLAGKRFNTVIRLQVRILFL